MPLCISYRSQGGKTLQPLTFPGLTPGLYKGKDHLLQLRKQFEDPQEFGQSEETKGAQH